MKYTKALNVKTVECSVTQTDQIKSHEKDYNNLSRMYAQATKKAREKKLKPKQCEVER